jgi:hypothetical protein
MGFIFDVIKLLVKAALILVPATLLARVAGLLVLPSLPSRAHRARLLRPRTVIHNSFKGINPTSNR